MLEGINVSTESPMNAMLWVRTFLSELHAWQWVGVLVARIAVGLLFFLSGRGKLFVPEHRERMHRLPILAAGKRSACLQ
jgi:uncharacterized membrane protein YphA (DoxX/SURF4 family)